MADLLSQLKDDVKTKIEVIKKIQDNPKINSSAFGENLIKDLPSIQGANLGKNLSDFQSKLNQKLQNKTDIFGDLVSLVESFIGHNSKNQEPTNKFFSKQKLKQITTDSIKATLKSSKKIIIDSAQKTLFAGDGICGTNKTFNVDSVNVSPKEFDFMNVLTIDPTTNVGQIVYEPTKTTPDNLIKMDRILYTGFTSNNPYNFTSKNGNTLFTMNWDSNNQVYNFSGLKSNPQQIGNFLSDYYSSIEFLDISGVTKNAVMMTINPDASATPLFNTGLNDLNRLLSKILCFCNNNNQQQNGLNQNAVNQFNENDVDDEYFFNFDDVEGIDLDDEARRFKKVIKFVDCGNNEVASRPEHFEDFSYLSNQNLENAVNSVLQNTALTAHNDSGNNIPADNFLLNLLNSFILNLPKALIGSVLSPKYLLPVVVVYKVVSSGLTNVITSVKTIMKNLSKFFKMLITEFFWKFITEFWSRIKKDLSTFLKNVALNILKNKQKRLLAIIGSLIALLTKLLENNLTNCNGIYGLINKTIDTSIAAKGGNIPIPPPLLLAATLRGGYSPDRATMNILEQLKKSGNPFINTNPINGFPNPVIDLVKSITNGHDEEFRNNNRIESFTIPFVNKTVGIVL